VSPRRAGGHLPRGRPPGMLIAAGQATSVAAFVFCLVASADGWHPAVTGPGIVVSVVAMVAWVLAARLRGDSQ
jgi:peptidoglycan/LPS O-acetylase OafA/YrhL